VITRIIADTVTTAAKTLSGKIQSFGFNLLQFSVLVGGTAHSEANFDNHVVNVTLRQRKGENKQLVNGIRLTDILKFSDFKSGFSLQQKGVAVGRYVGFLDMGRVRLEDDDQLEVSITCAGHASATYAFTVTAVNVKSGAENLIGYELIIGNGNELVVKDCYSLFLLSPASGATINVADSEGNYTVTDFDVHDLANCLGEMETYEDFGILYVDKYSLSQDVRVKLPNSTFALAVKGFFDPDRLVERADSEDVDADAVATKIGIGKPEKLRVLKMLGRLA